MILSPMRFKSFVWPHNPRVYSITYERKLAVHKIPFGRHCLQSLGQTRRVLRGEGEFVGEGAYDTFKALASVFYEETPGVLAHPVWMAATAWFAGLELRQEPRRDYVAYSFEFWEVVEAGDTGELERRPTQTPGTSTTPDDRPKWPDRNPHHLSDTPSAMERRYGVALERIIALNPDIRNPNLIYPGQRVRIS